MSIFDRMEGKPSNPEEEPQDTTKETARKLGAHATGQSWPSLSERLDTKDTTTPMPEIPTVKEEPDKTSSIMERLGQASDTSTEEWVVSGQTSLNRNLNTAPSEQKPVAPSPALPRRDILAALSGETVPPQEGRQKETSIVERPNALGRVKERIRALTGETSEELARMDTSSREEIRSLVQQMNNPNTSIEGIRGAVDTTTSALRKGEETIGAVEVNVKAAIEELTVRAKRENEDSEAVRLWKEQVAKVVEELMDAHEQLKAVQRENDEILEVYKRLALDVETLYASLDTSPDTEMRDRVTAQLSTLHTTFNERTRKIGEVKQSLNSAYELAPANA